MSVFIQFPPHFLSSVVWTHSHPISSQTLLHPFNLYLVLLHSQETLFEFSVICVSFIFIAEKFWKSDLSSFLVHHPCFLLINLNLASIWVTVLRLASLSDPVTITLYLLPLVSMKCSMQIWTALTCLYLQPSPFLVPVGQYIRCSLPVLIWLLFSSLQSLRPDVP